MESNNSQMLKEGTLPIKVSSEVVAHLSRNLYRNFSRAVKELISNAYDAGATEVKIKLDLKNERIIIRDNGKGMILSEVEDNFLHIARRTPFNEERDELGRQRIGSFGIGFLSTFPYCKQFELLTIKRGTSQVIVVKIETSPFFDGTDFQIQDLQVPYQLKESNLPKETGETIIILNGIPKHIVEELSEESRDKSTIDKMGGYERFKWTLAQYSPIEFPKERSDLREFFSVPGRVPLRLWLNAEELFRNVPDNAKIIEQGDKKFGSIEVKYAILSPYEPVKPKEGKGLQIRLRDVGIGLPRDFDIMKDTNRVPGKLSYLCGEVHVLKGLESVLMLDRDSFATTEDVIELFTFFRRRLSSWNDTLENWALRDKEVYQALEGVTNSSDIDNELKKADIIHIPKERLKIPKNTQIVKSKGTSAFSVPKRLREALSHNKDVEVISCDEQVTADKPPVQVIPEEKRVIIFDKHPDFIEAIQLCGKKFTVKYDEWDPNLPLAVCKIANDRVVFNKSHPLFKSQLSDEVVKKISLGFLLLVMERPDNSELLIGFNQLLKEIFLRA